MNCYSDISFFFFDDRRNYLLIVIEVLRKIKKKKWKMKLTVWKKTVWLKEEERLRWKNVLI